MAGDAGEPADAEADGDVPVTCYRIGETLLDVGDLDAAADAEEAVPDAAGDGQADGAPDEYPTCYFAGPPKEAAADRQERWARRTLLRAATVERLLADPDTHPAVREALARDVRQLRRRAPRILGS